MRVGKAADMQRGTPSTKTITQRHKLVHRYHRASNVHYDDYYINIFP